MATTVRIHERTSEALDEIQARLFLLTRTRVTKQDLLQLILEVGPDVDDLAARILGLKYPLSARARRNIRKRIVDWGVRTSEEDINRVLYGWD